MPFAALLSTDWTIRAISPALAELLGYRPSELIGRSGFEISAGDTAKRALVAKAAVARDGIEHHLALMLTRDGRTIACEVITRPLTTQNGDILYVVTAEPVGGDADQEMSKEEACAYCDLSPRTLERARARGELRAHKKRNGRIFYLRSELDVWRHR
jgi:PAS domain S-box-containing protein